MYVSPLPNVCSSISPSSTPSGSTIRCARAGWERPANTISRFCGPRSSQCPGEGCVTGSEDSSPGRTSSVVALPGCISLLVLLTGAGDPECIRGDVLGYDRSCGDPSPVSDLHRRNEAIVDGGPDVAADRRPPLRLAGLVRIVGRDRSRTDVRVLADLGIADVGQVGNLCPVADP